MYYPQLKALFAACVFVGIASVYWENTINAPYREACTELGGRVVQAHGHRACVKVSALIEVHP